MSDEVAKELTDRSGSEQETKVTLTISAFPDGRLEYHFPSNKVLAWGLLGAAQEQLVKLAVLADVQHSVQKSQAARGGMAGLLKRMNGGGH